MKFIYTLFIHISVCASVVCCAVQGYGQTRPFLRSSTPVTGAKTDSVKKDSVRLDTLAGNSGGLTTHVTYTAKDSTISDPVTKISLLYNDARVTYGDYELSAYFIRLDEKTHTLFAKGTIDKTTGRYIGRPYFKDGSEPPGSADSLTFNYVTKKANIYNVNTSLEEGYLQTTDAKKNQYDEISFRDGKYSTCNLPHPHYYIHITKGIAFEKSIVTGPAWLVIEDVTFPAILPFGFFPKSNKRQSGVLFPTFGEDATFGFFMRDLGYYIGISDYWDAEVRGTLYSKGSYEGSLHTRYDKNYKYNGSINLAYASRRFGVEGTPDYAPRKDFNIQWSHSQQPGAHPGTTFSASVNAGTSSYNQNTAAGGTYDIQQITRNTLSSSISYGRTFADGLFNFTSALGHTQDIESKTIGLTLPQFTLTMNSINPFDSKKRTGDQKWFQRISLTYSSTGSNSINTTESELFKSGSLKKFTNGIQHSFSMAFSQNIFKYFQANLSAPYFERWSFKTINKRFNFADSTVVVDTIGGFARSGEYSFNGGISTKVIGQVNFRKGKFDAIRHTMTPNIGFSYHPDFGTDKYGYYRSVQTNAAATQFERYSIFAASTAGSPGAGRSGSINFSLDNTLEARKRSTNDTSATNSGTSEKVQIIQGLSFSTSYNLAAPAYRLSDINFSGRTALLHQKLGINFSGAFNPYALDTAGNIVNVFAIRQGTLARLTSFGLSTGFSFNSTGAAARNDAINRGNENKSNLTSDQADALQGISRDPNAFVDFNIPWNLTASYSFNYSKQGLRSTITNTLNFSGDFNVTPKWKVQYNSGFDFLLHKLSYTSFAIYRDLHCWDLSMNWVPFGTYRSYSIDLKVRASILQDLKLSRRRDYYNSF